MKVISTQLIYILKALFRVTPLAYSFCTSGGQVAGGQVTGGRWDEKIGKWGIPENSI